MFNFYKLETKNHKIRFFASRLYIMYLNNEIICIYLMSLKSKLLIFQMNHPSIIEDMSGNVLVNSISNTNTKIISMAPCSTFKSKYRHNKPYKLYS